MPRPVRPLRAVPDPAPNAADTPALRAATYRAAALDAVTPDDVRAVLAAVLDRAKAGDLAAARLVLDRALGTAGVAEWPTAERVAADVRQAAFLDSLG